MTAAQPPPSVTQVPEGFRPRRFGSGFIDANGPLYVKQRAGAALLGFRVEPRHCNLMGICHGGMIATFCDMLLPIAAHALCDELAPRFLPTVSLQVDYLAPSKLGAWVQGEAQLLRRTRSLVFMQGRVEDRPAFRRRPGAAGAPSRGKVCERALKGDRCRWY